MATEAGFIAYVGEQVDLGDRLTSRKMFGEYAFYVDGKVVALACDNSLFVKPSAAAAALSSTLPLRAPYPGAKDYLVADELLDDTDALRRFLTETAMLMPASRPAKPRKTSGGRRGGKPAR